MAPRKPPKENTERKAGEKETYAPREADWKDAKEFTADDLGKRVQFNSALFAAAASGNSLSFRDAETVLRDRLTNLGDARYALTGNTGEGMSWRKVGEMVGVVAPDDSAYDGIPADVAATNAIMDYSAAQITANLILNTIPEEYRTADVLNTLDLRPYLAAMQDVGVAKVAAHEYVDPGLGNFFGRDVSETTSVDLSEISSFYLDKEQTRIAEALSKAQTDAGVAGTPAELQAKLEGAQAFAPGQAGLSPDADTRITTSVVQGGTVTNPFDPKTIAQQRQTFTPFDVEDFRQMVATDQWGLEQLAAQEKALAAEQGSGYFPVGVQEGSFSSLDVQGGKPVAPSQSRPMLSVNQAMDYLRTLSPSEVKDMQKKLAMAGYYDRVVQNAEGGMANAVPIEEGYAFDPATQAAWRLLLTDSVKENQPVWKILGQKAPTYREERRKKQLSGLAEIDNDMVGMAANDYAQSIIGRGLTNQEQIMLRDYLYSLREERAGFVVGADDNTADQNLPNEMGFTQGDIEEHLADTYGFEQSMAVAGERAYARRKMMGG